MSQTSLSEEVDVFLDWMLSEEMNGDECEYTIQCLVSALAVLSTRYQNPQEMVRIITKSLENSSRHLETKKLRLH